MDNSATFRQLEVTSARENGPIFSSIMDIHINPGDLSHCPNSFNPPSHFWSDTIIVRRGPSPPRATGTRIGRRCSRLRAFTHPTVDSSACPPPAARQVRRAVRGSRHDALRALVGDVRMRKNVLYDLINDRGASDPHLAVGARRNLVRRVRRYLCVRPISWARSGLARLVLRIGLRTTAL